jgi:hypothetical protein
MTADALELPPDVRLPGVQVDVLPFEAEHLPAVQAEHEDERVGAYSGSAPLTADLAAVTVTPS